MSTRVLIVDDHAVVRSGLRLVLEAEDGIEAVGEAGTAREAIFEARSTKPDVILLDVVMPDQSGLEAIPTLLKENPAVKILVLSMQDDPHYVREAFAAGAQRLRAQGSGRQRGRRRPCARSRAAGATSIPSSARASSRPSRRSASRAEEDPLSERESEVLRLLALGHTNQEIAKQLFISVRTAETHRAHIMQKLRLSSRAELVRYALERGLMENPPPLALLEDHEHAQLLVAGEAVLGMGGDEDGVPFSQLHHLALDRRACPCPRAPRRPRPPRAAAGGRAPARRARRRRARAPRNDGRPRSRRRPRRAVHERLRCRTGGRDCAVV